MTMNPTPEHLDDEILSALLDGDADAADGAGGDATAHLRACDRCAGRQAELAGAREALATAPVEPVDELTRRRLVAAALAAAETAPGGATSAARAVPIDRSRWARRHPAFIGSAAAVVLAVLVGVPFVLDNGTPGEDETLTAQAPLPESAGAFLGDLGDLSERDRLRLRLSGAAVSDTYATPPAEPGPSPAAGAPAAAPLASGSPAAGGLADSPNDAVSTTAAPGARHRASGSDAASKQADDPPPPDTATVSEGFAYGDQSARDRADTDRCVAVLLNGPARGGRLTRSGTGTYHGRPAIVASFDLSGGTEAFIADRSDCALLDRFSV
jgi:hypothetical protein